MTNPSRPEGTLLTAEDVKRWQGEAREIQARIERDQALLDGLTRKLAAASIFMAVAEFANVEEDDTLVATGTVESEPLTEAVPRILRARGRAMQPIEIKEALIKEGVPAETLGNYFYTVLLRLSHPKRRVIVKFGKKYKMPSPREPETAEARAVNGASAVSKSIPLDQRVTQPLSKEAN